MLCFASNVSTNCVNDVFLKLFRSDECVFLLRC
jgi:hypothetical protein